MIKVGPLSRIASVWFFGLQGRRVKKDSLCSHLQLALIQVHSCILSFPSTLLIPEGTSPGTFLRQTSFSLLKERKRSSYFFFMKLKVKEQELHLKLLQVLISWGISFMFRSIILSSGHFQSNRLGKLQTSILIDTENANVINFFFSVMWTYLSIVDTISTLNYLLVFVFMQKWHLVLYLT